jgi:hypothetical protein
LLAHVDFVRQRQDHGLPGERDIGGPIADEDLGHVGLATGGEHTDAVASADCAAHDCACESAEVVVRPIHPLHG